MRAYSTLVALSLYLVAAHASSLYMWSNTKYFNGKNIEVSEQTSNDVLNSALNGEGPLAKYLGDHIAPETIVVFVEPELTHHTPTLNSNSLSSSLVSSASSINIQKVTPQAAGAGLVLSLIQNLPTGATVTVARNAGSKLLTSLNGRPDIKFITHSELKKRKDSNGVSDFVVVVLDGPVSDVVIPILQSMSGNYLAMLTSAKPESEKDYLGSKVVQEVEAINDGISWDSELIEAVIVMIPFVIILLTGICCTCSLRSALKFDGEKKKR